MNRLSLQTSDDLFDIFPTATAIFDSKTLRLEYVNSSMLKLLDKDKSIIGLAPLDYLPELKDQGYADLLRIVGLSDTAYSEKGAEVKILKQGILKSVYMDYNYTPIKVVRKKPAGVLVTANEVCEKQLNMLSGEEYQRNLRAFVLAAPVAMCIFRGRQLNLEVVNSYMLELWQSEQYRNLRIIRDVFHTGHPLDYVEKGIRYSCTALRNEHGSSVGCILIAVIETNLHVPT
jgi:hypothetical protein